MPDASFQNALLMPQCVILGLCLLRRRNNAWWIKHVFKRQWLYKVSCIIFSVTLHGFIERHKLDSHTKAVVRPWRTLTNIPTTRLYWPYVYIVQLLGDSVSSGVVCVVKSVSPFVRPFHQAEPGCAVAGATLLPKSLRRSPARPQPLEQHPPQLSSTAASLSTVDEQVHHRTQWTSNTVDCCCLNLLIVHINLFYVFWKSKTHYSTVVKVEWGSLIQHALSVVYRKTTLKLQCILYVL